MKRYVVALEKEERDELAGITHKGSHQSQKVVNALILLNCDEGEFNEHRARGEAIAEILRISARKVDRVKKRFVEEGMEAALGGRQRRECIEHFVVRLPFTTASVERSQPCSPYSSYNAHQR